MAKMVRNYGDITITPRVIAGVESPTSSDGAQSNPIAMMVDDEGRPIVIVKNIETGSTGGSGVSGGGLSQYILTPNNSLNHGVTSRSTTDVIALGALPFTFDPLLIAKIERYNSSSIYQDTYTSVDTSFVYSGSNLSVSNMTSNGGDQFVIFTFGQERTIDNTLDSAKFVLQNPIHGRQVIEHLIASADLAAGTTRYTVDMQGYRYLTAHAKMSFSASLSASDYVKMWAFATLDDTATSTADTGWVNISQNLFGSASIQASQSIASLEGLYTIDTPTPYLNYMFKVESGGSTGSNAVDLWIMKSW